MIDPKQQRKRLNMNQSQFWNPLGITQSGGSRYESHRRIPKPIQILLTLAYDSDSNALKALKKLRIEK